MIQRLLMSSVFLLMTTTIFSQQPPIEPGVSQKLAEWRAAHYSNVRYGLNLTLEKMSPLMKGEIEIRVTLDEEASKNPLILDWRTTAFENDKDKPYANVVAVNNALDIRSQVNNEHILIPNGLLKVGENVVKIQFASPIKTSGSAITRYVDKEDGSEYIYSLFVPSDASTAFPVFDQPDLKARFQLSIWTSNYPKKDWKFISNGKLIHKESSDFFRPIDVPIDKIAHWSASIYAFEETKPISTYAFAFAAGDFARVSEDGLRRASQTPSGISNGNFQPLATANGSDIYIRKSQAEKFKQYSAEIFRLNRECVKYLEEYFDYKFPFPKYDLVLIPEFPFGGMEHAGATFLRESSIIFPSEPTKNDLVSRANLIFHEAAHQWFGDTVTMKWFDDLWLKEGFATFMGFKALEKIMPEMNAWKVFYERTKQGAYQTDSTKGTTPIYQEISNLSAAKSAYGNIVYNKAPAFLRQAEFYLGEKEFQTAVRSFLKKNEFKNATWQDLVKEFETVSWSPESYPYFKKLTAKRKRSLEETSKKQIRDWAEFWVRKEGVALIRVGLTKGHREISSNVNSDGSWTSASVIAPSLGLTLSPLFEDSDWALRTKTLYRYDLESEIKDSFVSGNPWTEILPRLFNKDGKFNQNQQLPDLIFPNYQDYGYGIFLLDDKSRNYILENVQNEKDDFLRSMMYGSLWDSVREAELDPKEYVELVIKNVATEKDEMIVASMLGRANTALNYYIKSEPSAVADGLKREIPNSTGINAYRQPFATANGSDLAAKLEEILINKMQTAETQGQKITFYRSFLNIAKTERAKNLLKDFLNPKAKNQSPFPLKTKDKFDIVTKLFILGDKDAENLLSELVKTETSDDAKRYAYAARAGIATAESKAKFWNDFVANREISESWIEAAFVSFNSIKHSDLTLPYLEKALSELPNLKRNRKIFFVNGWLSAFIGGQKSEKALEIINKFLADNPNLDKDLKLKILENADVIERAVNIRKKFST